MSIDLCNHISIEFVLPPVGINFKVVISSSFYEGLTFWPTSYKGSKASLHDTLHRAQRVCHVQVHERLRS